MIGELIIMGMAIVTIILIHVFVIYGHVVFIPSIYRGEMDFGGWLMYIAVLFGTVLLVAFWCLVFGV